MWFGCGPKGSLQNRGGRGLQHRTANPPFHTLEPFFAGGGPTLKIHFWAAWQRAPSALPDRQRAKLVAESFSRELRMSVDEVLALREHYRSTFFPGFDQPPEDPGHSIVVTPRPYRRMALKTRHMKWLCATFSLPGAAPQTMVVAVTRCGMNTHAILPGRALPVPPGGAQSSWSP